MKAKRTTVTIDLSQIQSALRGIELDVAIAAEAALRKAANELTDDLIAETFARQCAMYHLSRER